MEMESKQFRSMTEERRMKIPEGCEKTPAKRTNMGMRILYLSNILATDNNSQV